MLIYATIAIVLLLAIASLAVEWGHAQVVRSQLQQVAEASARYAAVGLSLGPARARAYATDVARENPVDGKRVVLTAADVELGIWDSEARTFTALAAAGEGAATAVRVTARRIAARDSAVPLPLASLVGMPSVDVQASAVASAGPDTYGLIGLDSITMKGNTTASYRSDGTSSGKAGNVASNGNITLSGSSYINGSARPGTAGTVSGGGGRVSGSTSPLKAPLSFPNGDAGIYATNNDNVNVPSQNRRASSFELNSGDSLTLPGGTYYVNNVSIAGSLSFAGPTTIYCYGWFAMSGNAQTSASLPKNLTIIMCPTPSGGAPGAVIIGSSSALHASIYAPQSPVILSGTGDIYGSVLGKSVNMTGSSGIQYDLALTGGSGGSVKLVR